MRRVLFNVYSMRAIIASSILFNTVLMHALGKMYRVRLLAVLVCLLPLLQSCVYYRTALEEEYRKQADKLFTEEQYKESLEYYKKVKRISFSNNARYRMAEIYIRLNNLEDARKEIIILKRRDKKNVLVQELDAYWYFASGDFDTALEKYLALEVREPYNTRVLSNIGIIYQNLRNSLLAVEYFNKVLQIQTLSPFILESYMEAIIAINASANSVEQQQEQNNIYLSMIVKRYIESYNSKEFSMAQLYDIALVLKKHFIEYTYPIFSIIADGKDDDSSGNITPAEQKLIASANYDIVELILNKEYVPLEVDSLQLILSHLATAIDKGMGATRVETEQLMALVNKVTTVVLKRRLYQLYFEKEIISKVEYDTLLVELNTVQIESSEQETASETPSGEGADRDEASQESP